MRSQVVIYRLVPLLRYPSLSVEYHQQFLVESTITNEILQTHA